MPSVANYVLDAAVAKLQEGTRLLLCSSDPVDYAAAVAATIATKTAPSITGPTTGGGGRRATIATFTDGVVNNTGEADFYALVDHVNSRLLAAQAMTAPQVMTAGNPWTLTAAITITIPFPT